MTGACCCGMLTNPGVAERSYLWIMENRMEANYAIPNGCTYAQDKISVDYFDAIPALLPLTFCQKVIQCRSDGDTPSVEWFDDSTLVCFMPCPSCRAIGSCCCPICCKSGEALFVVPYEIFPVPCCCCSNRTSSCGCPCASTCSSLQLVCCLFNPAGVILTVMSFGIWASCCLACGEGIGAMDGNCLGCCGATTGSPKFKIDFLPGGLKDPQTAKEAACKINAVTGVYFKPAN